MISGRPRLRAWSLRTPEAAVLRLPEASQQIPIKGGIAGIVELTDGTIVIADAQALELRAFDHCGLYLWSAGRGGEGAGEFTRSINQLFRVEGDSLLAADGAGRVLVFSGNGRFERMWTLETHREGLMRPSPAVMRASGYLSSNSSPVRRVDRP